MGILLYVGGDISRTGVLADLPPFQRRLAIFAQAALFERHAYGHVGVEHFTKWAIGQRGRRFYYQTLSELREEPRWVADYCTPDQLKAEFLGRIRSEEHTSELQSLMRISYAVFCLTKKKQKNRQYDIINT